jgi:hypothetical protein
MPLYVPKPALYVQDTDTPAFHGMVEWNGNPAYTSASNGPTSGTILYCRILAQTGGLISNIVTVVSAAGSGMTAATTSAVSNVTNNGSGFCRITDTAHGYTTNDVIYITGVVGATEANTSAVITVIDANTFDLVGVPFTSAYTSGGNSFRSANLQAIYDGNGNFLTSTADLVGAWGSTNLKEQALVNKITINAGSTYYIATLFNGASLAYRSFGNNVVANVKLAGASQRWGNGATGISKLPNAFTPSGLALGVSTLWCGLS